MSREPLIIDMPAPKITSSPAESRLALRLQSVSLAGMIGLLICGVLAFGTTEFWSMHLQRMGAVALLVFWCVQQYLHGALELSRNYVYLTIVGLGSIGILQFLFGATGSRDATLSELLNLAAYGIFTLLAGELLNRRRRLLTFATCMAIFGFLLSLFSLVQKFSGVNDIYGFRKVTAVSASVFGPYANHNHYAGLMEMLAPLAIAVGLLEREAKRYLFFFAGCVMAASIYISGSRGGIVASTIGIIFGCVMVYRQQPERRTLFRIACVILALAFLAVLFGTEKDWKRASDTQDVHRMSLAQDSLRMAVAKPILGFGLGAYVNVYPKFQTFNDEKSINHAHNDYLELLVETGIIGFGLFAVTLAFVYRAGMRKMRQLADEEGRLLTFGALTGITALLVHSSFDFNLHIPANAAIFFVLCSAVATPFKRSIQPAQVQAWETEWRVERSVL